MENDYSKSIFFGSQCDTERTKESFVRMSIDEFFERISSQEFRRIQDDIEFYRGRGELKIANVYEATLPIFYPSADFTKMSEKNVVAHNGMVVITMKSDSLDAKIEAMEHLEAWKFVKGFYRNIRSNIVIFAWMGYCNDKKELRLRRKKALELMSAALPKMKFDCRRRLIRGVMMCYDPNWSFWRDDSEVEGLEELRNLGK